MDMPTALIAEDEPHLAAELASRLARFWPELQIACMARNGIEALAELNARQLDVAFLDIRMPGIDGFQVARLAPQMQIVFVTAYEEYAVRAFDTPAVDYLLKPVTDERMLSCVARLQRGTTAKATLADGEPPSAPIKWLTVGYKDMTRLVSVEEVLYFQASDKYTEVVTAEHRHVIRTPLKELLRRLDPAQFAQVHRSVIVAMAQIKQVERDILGRLRIHLKGRAEILPVSRGCIDLFRQM